MLNKIIVICFFSAVLCLWAGSLGVAQSRRLPDLTVHYPDRIVEAFLSLRPRSYAEKKSVSHAPVVMRKKTGNPLRDVRWDADPNDGLTPLEMWGGAKQGAGSELDDIDLKVLSMLEIKPPFVVVVNDIREWECLLSALHTEADEYLMGMTLFLDAIAANTWIVQAEPDLSEEVIRRVYEEYTSGIPLGDKFKVIIYKDIEPNLFHEKLHVNMSWRYLVKGAAYNKSRTTSLYAGTEGNHAKELWSTLREHPDALAAFEELQRALHNYPRCDLSQELFAWLCTLERFENYTAYLSEQEDGYIASFLSNIGMIQATFKFISVARRYPEIINFLNAYYDELWRFSVGIQRDFRLPQRSPEVPAPATESWPGSDGPQETLCSVLRPVAYDEVLTPAQRIERRIREIDSTTRVRLGTRNFDEIHGPMLRYILSLPYDEKILAAEILVRLSYDPAWVGCRRNHNMIGDIGMLCAKDTVFYNLLEPIMADYIGRLNPATDETYWYRVYLIDALLDRIFEPVGPVSEQKAFAEAMEKKLTPERFRRFFAWRSVLHRSNEDILITADGRLRMRGFELDKMGYYDLVYGGVPGIGFVYYARDGSQSFLALSLRISYSYMDLTGKGIGTMVMGWAVKQVAPGGVIVSLSPPEDDDIKFFFHCLEARIFRGLEAGVSVKPELSKSSDINDIQWHGVKDFEAAKAMRRQGFRLFLKATVRDNVIVPAQERDTVSSVLRPRPYTDRSGRINERPLEIQVAIIDWDGTVSETSRGYQWITAYLIAAVIDGVEPDDGYLRALKKCAIYEEWDEGASFVERFRALGIMRNGGLSEETMRAVIDYLNNDSAGKTATQEAEWAVDYAEKHRQRSFGDASNRAEHIRIWAQRGTLEIEDMDNPESLKSLRLARVIAAKGEEREKLLKEIMVPGSYERIKKMKAGGLRLDYVSGADQRAVQMEAEIFGLAECATSIRGASHADPTQTKERHCADIYAECRASGLVSAPWQIADIGDGVTEMAIGLTMGFTRVGVSQPYRNGLGDILRKKGAQFIIPGLDSPHLDEILKNPNAALAVTTPDRMLTHIRGMPEVRIVVAAADSDSALEGVNELIGRVGPSARIWLVGDKAAIERVIREGNFTDIADIQDDKITIKGNITIIDVDPSVQLRTAVSCAIDYKAHVLLKGNTSTDPMMEAITKHPRKRQLVEQGTIVSHARYFPDTPLGPVLFADGGINPVESIADDARRRDQKEKIVRNTIRLAQVCGMREPHVYLVVGDKERPSRDLNDAADILKRFDDANVSIITAQEAFLINARTDAQNGSIFIFPDINVNILYKAFQIKLPWTLECVEERAWGEGGRIAVFKKIGQDGRELGRMIVTTPPPDADVKTKRALLDQATKLMNGFGVSVPNIAGLSFTERAENFMHVPSVADNNAIIEQIRAEGVPCVIEQLSWDMAASEEAAGKKAESKVAGQADILMCPTNTTGSALTAALKNSSELKLPWGTKIDTSAGSAATVAIPSRADHDKFQEIVMAAYVTDMTRAPSVPMRVYCANSDPLFLLTANRFIGNAGHPVELGVKYSMEELERILRQIETIKIFPLRNLELGPYEEYYEPSPLVTSVPTRKEQILQETLEGLRNGTVAYCPEDKRFYIVIDNNIRFLMVPWNRVEIYDQDGEKPLAIIPYGKILKMREWGKVVFKNERYCFQGPSADLYSVAEDADYDCLVPPAGIQSPALAGEPAQDPSASSVLRPMAAKEKKDLENGKKRLDLRGRYVFFRAHRWNSWIASRRNAILNSYGDRTTYAFITYYMLYYLKHEVGVEFVNDFFRFIILDGISMQQIDELLAINTDEEMKQKISELFSYGGSPEESPGKIAAAIDALMYQGRLTVEEKAADEAELDRAAKRAYRLMGGGADAERESIVRSFAEVSNKSIPLDSQTMIFHLTSHCDNQCAFCEIINRDIQSAEKRDREGFYNKGIAYAKQHPGLDTLILGGEVIKYAMQDTEFIIRSANGKVFVTTNGSFAVDPDAAKKVITRLWDLVKDRCGSNDGAGEMSFVLQVSFDSFHQEPVRLSGGTVLERVPMKNIANIVRVVAENFPRLNITLIGRFEPFMDEMFSELTTELEDQGFLMAHSPQFDQYEDVAFPDPVKGVEVKKAKSSESCVLLYANNGRPVRGRVIGLLRDFAMPTGRGSLLSQNRFAYYPIKEKGRGDISDFDEFMQQKACANTGIIISADGNVYLSDSAFDHQWRAGNLMQEGLERILDVASKDPLVTAWKFHPDLVIKLACELYPGLDQELRKAYYPWVAFLDYLRSPSLRLYLTKRIIQYMAEEEEIVPGIVEALPLVSGFSLNELKFEYFLNLAEEKGTPGALAMQDLYKSLNVPIVDVSEIMVQYLRKKAQIPTNIPSAPSASASSSGVLRPVAAGEKRLAKRDIEIQIGKIERGRPSDWFLSTPYQPMITYVMGLGPTERVYAVDNLILRTSDSSYCAVNHYTAAALGYLCQKDPSFADIIGDLIPGYVRSGFHHAALDEIVACIYNEAPQKTLMRFNQVMGERLDPMDFHRLFKLPSDNLPFMQNAVSVPLRGNQYLQLFGFDNQENGFFWISLAEFGHEEFPIIGSLCCSPINERRALVLSLRVYTHTGNNVGTTALAWAIQTYPSDYVVTMFPSRAPDIDFFFHCVKAEIFEDVEVGISGHRKISDGADIDSVKWEKVRRPEEALAKAVAGKSLFLRARVGLSGKIIRSPVGAATSVLRPVAYSEGSGSAGQKQYESEYRYTADLRDEAGTIIEDEPSGFPGNWLFTCEQGIKFESIEQGVAMQAVKSSSLGCLQAGRADITGGHVVLVNALSPKTKGSVIGPGFQLIPQEGAMGLRIEVTPWFLAESLITQRTNIARAAASLPLKRPNKKSAHERSSSTNGKPLRGKVVVFNNPCGLQARSHSKVFMSPLLLASILKEAGFEVVFSRFNMSSGSPDDLRRELDGASVALISDMGGDARLMDKFIKRARGAAPGCRFVSGGPPVTAMPESRFAHLRGITFYRGECDRDLAGLVSAVIRSQSASSAEKIPEIFGDFRGVCVDFDGGFYCSELGHVNRIDKLDLTSRKYDFSFLNQEDLAGPLSLTTSIRCPSAKICKFCQTAAGRGWISMEPVDFIRICEAYEARLIELFGMGVFEKDHPYYKASVIGISDDDYFGNKEMGMHKLQAFALARDSGKLHCSISSLQVRFVSLLWRSNGQYCLDRALLGRISRLERIFVSSLPQLQVGTDHFVDPEALGKESYYFKLIDEFAAYCNNFSHPIIDDQYNIYYRPDEHMPGLILNVLRTLILHCRYFYTFRCSAMLGVIPIEGTESHADMIKKNETGLLIDKSGNIVPRISIPQCPQYDLTPPDAFLASPHIPIALSVDLSKAEDEMGARIMGASGQDAIKPHNRHIYQMYYPLRYFGVILDHLIAHRGERPHPGWYSESFAPEVLKGIHELVESARMLPEDPNDDGYMKQRDTFMKEVAVLCAKFMTLHYEELNHGNFSPQIRDEAASSVLRPVAAREGRRSVRFAISENDLVYFREMFDQFLKDGILSSDGMRVLFEADNKELSDKTAQKLLKIIRYFRDITNMTADQMVERFPEEYFKSVTYPKISSSLPLVSKDPFIMLVDECIGCFMCPVKMLEPASSGRSPRMGCMSFPLLVMLKKAGVEISKDSIEYEPLNYKCVSGALFQDVCTLFNIRSFYTHVQLGGQPHSAVVDENIECIARSGRPYSIYASVHGIDSGYTFMKRSLKQNSAALPDGADPKIDERIAEAYAQATVSFLNRLPACSISVRFCIPDERLVVNRPSVAVAWDRRTRLIRNKFLELIESKQPRALKGYRWHDMFALSRQAYSMLYKKGNMSDEIWEAILKEVCGFPNYLVLDSRGNLNIRLSPRIVPVNESGREDHYGVPSDVVDQIKMKIPPQVRMVYLPEVDNAFPGYRDSQSKYVDLLGIGPINRLRLMPHAGLVSMCSILNDKETVRGVDAETAKVYKTINGCI